MPAGAASRRVVGGGRSALLRLVSIRHKPLFRPRVRYGVERNRQVDGARRRERASDLERGLPRRGPRAPTQALVAHEFADRVIARAGQSQLLGAFSNATPCLRSRLTVAIVS